jgi:hypothetical protein
LDNFSRDSVSTFLVPRKGIRFFFAAWHNQVKESFHMAQFINVVTKAGNRSINLDLVRSTLIDPRTGNMFIHFSETDMITLDAEEPAKLQKTNRFSFPKPKAGEPQPAARVSSAISVEDLLAGAVPPSDQGWMR